MSHGTFPLSPATRTPPRAGKSEETTPQRGRRSPMCHNVARHSYCSTALLHLSHGIAASQWICRAPARDAGKASSYQPAAVLVRRVWPGCVGGDQQAAVVGARQRTHAPRRVSARGRGVWTLAGASVECRVVSGATAASADQTGCAEQRDGAGGGDAECDDAEVRDGQRAGWRRDAGGLVIQAIAAD